MKINVDYKIRCVDNKEKLKPVLDLCYSILGEHRREMTNYTYKEWEDRISKWPKVLLYAETDGRVISAVLGRPENDDSLVMGFVACDEKYRKKGITESLVLEFERNAKLLGFKYITLGADPSANGFYDKCGYSILDENIYQRIYQKVL